MWHLDVVLKVKSFISVHYLHQMEESSDDYEKQVRCIKHMKSMFIHNLCLFLLSKCEQTHI